MGIRWLQRKTAHMRCRHGGCGRFRLYFLFEYPLSPGTSIAVHTSHKTMKNLRFIEFQTSLFCLEKLLWLINWHGIAWKLGIRTVWVLGSEFSATAGRQRPVWSKKKFSVSWFCFFHSMFDVHFWISFMWAFRVNRSAIVFLYHWFHLVKKWCSQPLNLWTLNPWTRFFDQKRSILSKISNNNLALFARWTDVVWNAHRNRQSCWK